MVTIIAMMGLMTATFTATAQENNDASEGIRGKRQVLTVVCVNLLMSDTKSEYLGRRRK